ncbi:MAG: hypothetical protein NXY57DRAFT_962872 [Lentinula lateritia]|uniref:F-box domain-containing protein n=1 Tax=Lentinula lateritia TaxID=40482 RepID=A0ABQ8VM06_9AGAR|nr:MAG: hypothetical protein NXY57DRAFT_962872 [Lentinula lateritia]KAJ4497433.1 hypothetical protein C8R41DRAFT_917471 [Lentinula lateritia]
MASKINVSPISPLSTALPTIKHTQDTSHMVQLLTFPEELLSHICDETEIDSLIPLAKTWLFNRIAGRRYLRLKEYDAKCSHLTILGAQGLPDQRREPPVPGNARSFDETLDISSVLNSLVNITFLSCAFSASPQETVRQMGVLVHVLQAISRDRQCQPLFSIHLKFTGPSPSWHGDNNSRFRASHLGKAFQDLIGELRRLRCYGFRIEGIMPPHISFYGDCPYLQRRMLKGKIQNDVQASDIQLLVDFAIRHPQLRSVSCGEQFIVTSKSPRCANGQFNIDTLNGTMSQLHYLLSLPNTLRDLRAIEICREGRSGISLLDIGVIGFGAQPRLPNLNQRLKDSQIQFWELLALICNRSSIVQITIPFDLFGFNFTELVSPGHYLRSSITTSSILSHVGKCRVSTYGTFGDPDTGVQFGEGGHVHTFCGEAMAVPSWASYSD